MQRVIQETIACEILIAVSAMTAVPQNQTQNNNNHQTQNNGYGGRHTGSFITDCGRCGKSHMSNACFVYGQSCRGCGRTRHFQSCCRFGRSVLSLVVEPPPLGFLHNSNQRALSGWAVWAYCTNV